MTKLNIKKDISKKVEKTVAIGSFIEISGRLHVIAQCDNQEVAAISLVNGNRHSDPVFVQNTTNITEQEMKEIVGGYDYNYVDTVNINYN